MQLDTRLPLMAGQRQPMQFAPESQLQTLSRIAPGINALRGVQQQQMETAEAVRKQQAYQQFQSEVAKAFPGGVKELSRVFLTHGTTSQHFDVGQKLMQMAMEEDDRQKIFGGGAGGGAGAPAMAEQPAAMPAAAPEPVPEMDFGAAGGARPVNAMMAQAAPAPMGAPAAPAKMLDYAGRQYSPDQVGQMLQSRDPQLQQLGRAIADANKPKTNREFAPSEISRLQQEIAQLPAGDPRRTPLEQRIQMLTTRPPAASTSVEVKLPELEKKERQSKGEFNVKLYETISQAARLAARTLPAIDTQINILDQGFRTGFGAEAQKAAASVLSALGVPEATKYASDAQAFTSALNQMVLQRQLEQKGPQTEADAQRITQTASQLGNTREANRFILDVTKAQSKRDIEQRSFWDKWWKENKTYEGVEDAWYAGDGGKSLFDRPELRKYVPQPAAAAPARAPQTGRPAGVGADWTLKQDAKGNRAWVSPDGKRFVEVK
jgi:hypothetical protein